MMLQPSAYALLFKSVQALGFKGRGILALSIHRHLQCDQRTTIIDERLRCLCMAWKICSASRPCEGLMRTPAAKTVRSLLSTQSLSSVALICMRSCFTSPAVSYHVQQRHCSSSIMQAVTMPTSLGDRLKEDKKELRKQIKQQLKQMFSEDMQQQSSRIANQVLQSQVFKSARSVGLYITCERLREVDTMDILTAAMQQGKQCFIPLVEDNQSNMSLLHIDTREDLQPAPPFGILEPKRQNMNGSDRQEVCQAAYGLDLLLMPGLGFDKQGRRLGRGGGYYDKLVHRLDDRAVQQGWQKPWLVALSFQEQLVPEVPVDDHDRHVDVLATADGLLLCSDRARQSLSARR